MVLTSFLVAGLIQCASVMALPLVKRGVRSGLLTSCTSPNQFALTFDDGPYEFTSALIDYLVSEDVVATFFVNGNDYWSDEAEIDQVLQKAFSHNMEIASHTYTHPDLSTLSDDEVRKQMTDNENVIMKAIGKKPAVMRPPYGSVTDRQIKVLNDIGYSVVTWNIDEQDWQSPSLDEEETTLERALATNSPTGYISLEHDVYEQTATELAPAIVKAVKAKGLKFVTVADCLGVSPYQ
ncbi:glycoside hydrolase/deacetylase [Hesseltinella vesiculosa]|uniref:Glycoside hydrolase/deacetylase n=1 Tax=Hesseltinella vesiculosa TaxID=101127 RepID=A0A1X2GMV7_9FUNG|nr:glycoside hydrolase/deacetylase [Hesseltinella vesiculosa]